MSAVDTVRPREIAGRNVLASAKINLALHVVGRRPDGYHDLDSLVVFAKEGDRLDVAPADHDALRIEGPFAGPLRSQPENILLEALGLARDIACAIGEEIGPLALRLDKRLPVASGIGGGSADAAAFLRIVAAARPELAGRISEAAARLGADVPMCLDGRPARIGGIGDVVRPVANMPALPLLLVNPGTGVPTPSAFSALERRANPPLPPVPEAGFADVEALADYLGRCRNDLEAPAVVRVPEIARVRDRLAETGSRLVRMSGSGATVFALYSSVGEARSAAAALRSERPGWWVAATSSFAANEREAIR